MSTVIFLWQTSDIPNDKINYYKGMKKNPLKQLQELDTWTLSVDLADMDKTDPEIQSRPHAEAHTGFLQITGSSKDTNPRLHIFSLHEWRCSPIQYLTASTH